MKARAVLCQASVGVPHVSGGRQLLLGLGPASSSSDEGGRHPPRVVPHGPLLLASSLSPSPLSQWGMILPSRVSPPFTFSRRRHASPLPGPPSPLSRTHQIEGGHPASIVAVARGRCRPRQCRLHQSPLLPRPPCLRRHAAFPAGNRCFPTHLVCIDGRCFPSTPFAPMCLCISSLLEISSSRAKRTGDLRFEVREWIQYTPDKLLQLHKLLESND